MPALMQCIPAQGVGDTGLTATGESPTTCRRTPQADQPKCGNQAGRSPARARPSTTASVASFTAVRIPAVFQLNSAFERVITGGAWPKDIMRD